ncbi:DUF3306 domain-containing protein [Salinarimonas sp.]|uniref:DUF3306 domain-containing protein n=1 Tax=Salinarimonas sp. TaxID=2766526 RepID=UPI0032D94B18
MSGEGFLSRWSRRKREEVREEVRAAEEPDENAVPQPTPEAEPAAEPAPVAESAQTLSEEELAALPPIETIDETTDISGYLREGVPAALKNAALRRVWATSPAIRDYLDPAREYAYDWNVPGGVPGDGPLGPNFDAKALADRIFARHQTKVEDPDERTADAQEARGDPPQGGEGNPAVAAADPAEDEGPMQRTVGSARYDVRESSAAHGFAGEAEASEAAPSPQPTPENTAEPRVFRPRPRRHGGATPV